MSFKETYYRYYPELVRYGRHLLEDEAGTEDLVQETFLRYHLELSKEPVIENSRAWLYKVLHNLALSRNKSKRLHYSKLRRISIADSGQDTLDQMAEKEKSELVLQVLEQMPENEKKLLLLYHHGLKYKEMAEVLDINPKSIGTMLMRAINKLKLLLKKEYHELF